MKTRERDVTDRTVTISGRFPSGANVVGVSNGVLWRIVKAAVGFYDVYFDAGYTAISVVAESDVAGYEIQPYNLTQGYFGLRIPNAYAGAGTADASGWFRAELRAPR